MYIYIYIYIYIYMSSHFGQRHRLLPAAFASVSNHFQTTFSFDALRYTSLPFK